MIDWGKSDSKIAKELGITRASVWSQRQRRGKRFDADNRRKGARE